VPILLSVRQVNIAYILILFFDYEKIIDVGPTLPLGLYVVYVAYCFVVYVFPRYAIVIFESGFDL